MKKKDLKDIFSKYVPREMAEKLATGKKLPESSGGNRIQQRAVVAITLADPSGFFLSSQLHNEISTLLKDLTGEWIIESLAPLPFLSAPADKLVKTEFDSLLHRLASGDWKFRAICAIGSVDFGNVGSQSFMSFGSTGPLVSWVGEGAIVLPRPLSWGNKAVADLLQRPIQNPIEVSHHEYYRL